MAVVVVVAERERGGVMGMVVVFTKHTPTIHPSRSRLKKMGIVVLAEEEKAIVGEGVLHGILEKGRGRAAREVERDRAGEKY